MYSVFNNNYPDDTNINFNTLDEVKEHLKYMFQTSFTIVEDDDPILLENTFNYCSQSRFNSINDMSYEELVKEFDNEYDYTLKII